MTNKPAAPGNYRYKMGSVTQWCEKCNWKEERLKKEKSHCPECGAAIEKNCILKFGGMQVRLGQSVTPRFYFSYRGGSLEEVECDEADFPDTIVFMLKHGNWWA
jgi:hypothetical protein